MEEKTNEALVVITTTETVEAGERLAALLVEEELAACAQVIGPMTSVYRWEGRIERASEALILVKTTRSLYASLEAAIKRHHSYQTPEIIALPVESGSTDYLSWLHAQVKAG